MILFHKIRPFVLIVVGLAICALASEKLGPLENQVVVQRLDAELPAGESQISRFLWKTFANKTEADKFGEESSVGWQEKFHKFRNKLISKAGVKKLDSNSLGKCLDEVFNDAKTKSRGLAYLPVGAYATKQGSTAVWIVVVRWETEGSDPLSHIRMFAFDAQKHALIGFSTCG